MRISKLLRSILFVIFAVSECSSYRILGIFPFNAKSHMMMFEELMKGLARKGHRVDVISPFPLKKPVKNYNDIEIPSALPKLVNNMTYEGMKEIMKNDIVKFIALEAGNRVCAEGLEHPELQRLIKNPPKNPPYDLVIVEIFSAHCFMAFGPHYNVPVIGISSAALYPWSNDMIANPENLAFVPNNLLEYKKSMNFWDRLYNFLHTFYYKRYFDYHTSAQDDIIRKHFGANSPGIREVERDLALIIVNSHYALNGVKPTTPGLIEVGGLHVQDDGPDIPEDDRKWLDESPEGFVYFTFGSMMQIESFPPHVLDILYKSLRKISPVRVLMKIPRPELLPPGLPGNIRTFSWMPQLKVLKHPKIRAFITHGGLMGTQEAITYAVPMIGMPIFADQFVNIDLYVAKKIALRVDPVHMTQEKLDWALNEILFNPVYKETSKKVSARFTDRPRSALDTAIYWVEYVIRYGNKPLRSPALDLAWWQIALLDVYAAAILLIVSVIFIIIALVRFLVRAIIATHVSSAKKIN
ncbi:UDP-glucuronosyltransferase 2B20 [Diachasma alloeum]|uniref:UDP-glucuronosyltransferase 2B20 n=1 Tax=Diachasma alloeum TaxID=454923 RepID=UPI000738462C|nr:UDP-glucuronosyltransferase 2B20 [Diachasma alloeum]XP_015113244.1 UDP-glucuronosyltransferase 2B20 [Diachasma alloeum]XP_015113245.1 UDP-glucuronosyltransferase 2B20 [Diachasma alloeum]XP_015113246.1 UDP-glucuronosyltransferase 2B20 [Diachasma alloeum]